MADPVKLAVERRVIDLALCDILPMRRVLDSIKQTVRYKRIAASIIEVGIVEPLVVARRAKEGDLSCWLTAICDTPLCWTSGAARHRAWLPMTTRPSHTINGSIGWPPSKSIT